MTQPRESTIGVQLLAQIIVTLLCAGFYLFDHDVLGLTAPLSVVLALGWTSVQAVIR